MIANTVHVAEIPVARANVARTGSAVRADHACPHMKLTTLLLPVATVRFAAHRVHKPVIFPKTAADSATAAAPE